jgi:hypothetical protein
MEQQLPHEVVASVDRLQFIAGMWGQPYIAILEQMLAEESGAPSSEVSPVAEPPRVLRPKTQPFDAHPLALIGEAG